MRTLSRWQALAASAALLAVSPGCTSEAPPAAGTGFVRADGLGFVDAEDKPLVLRSVTFRNWVDSPSESPDTHHDEADYARVRAMGLNSVQFQFSYRWFEGDDSSGFERIDRNIAWAKAHGLLLVLALAEPPGGAQWPCERGAALWDDSNNRISTIELWGAIAHRYAAEPTVAAYQLLTDAAPTVSAGQWQSLATDIVARIRQEDRRHLAIVTNTTSIACDYDGPRADTFMLVPDENVAHSFVFNRPWYYTAQLTDSTGLGDGGYYPDDSRLVVDWWHVGDDGWLGWSADSTPGPEALRVKPEETEWTRKRFFYTVTDPNYAFVSVNFGSTNNPGTACVDDVVVREYESGFDESSPVRTVYDLDLELGSEWYLWQYDPLHGTAVVSTGADGARGESSVCVSSSNMDTNISKDYLLPARFGNTLEVSSSVKGIDSDPDGASFIKLDFFQHDTELRYRNRAYFEAAFGELTELARERGVPLYVHGLGTGKATFENDKGGLDWVRDVLGVVDDAGLSFSYYSYHGDSYGMYRGDSGLPDPGNANQALIELVTATYAR